MYYMAGRRKAGNERKRNVSLATSGLALFFLHCVEMGAMFISQAMSEQQMPLLPPPQRLGHAQHGDSHAELGVYVESQPHLPAVLLSRVSIMTHQHTVLQSDCSRRIWRCHGLK